MPSMCHYRGNQLDALQALGERNHLFGPDICGPSRPGEVLGHGAFYEVVKATFDAEYIWPDGTIGRTTAEFIPYVDPRNRIRYHGGDGPEPDVVGGDGPTLADRDRIAGR